MEDLACCAGCFHRAVVAGSKFDCSGA